MYLKRDGTQVEHLPVLDDYAKDDPNMGVETAYFVELFDENHHLLGRLEMPVRRCESFCQPKPPTRPMEAAPSVMSGLMA